ncbi:hypothetical protein CfE428DRAFT_0751 [Chthoniobacter flavus Ellin428]|uniref:Uncharacterized protein n=1 Tax=Chthoniobacter flavus Ellin428 TaxID=497964 RepID=B4CVR4_9BACT|nr:hypothetical protein [Chthoniobacter flavus]EDY21506.1 hypothetical protein CfE428DRAFT_0751 [Chthoniobacter flavus Ellin428]TCO95457.1 hypothetical protein EV701_101144 [Chthoniobacter flavus]
MSDKLSQTVLCHLADSDIQAIDEYAEELTRASGGAVLGLSKAARVRALFRLGVECWVRRANQTKTQTT